MFKRNGICYTMLLFGCCFCQWDSDAKVFSSKDILSSWTYLAQLNSCADGSATSSRVTDITINPCSIDDFEGEGEGEGG
jgi:hypothetical protein